MKGETTTVSCYLRALAHHLPRQTRTNSDLVRLNPSWNEEAIFRKTGIRSRPIASDGETAVDLGCAAAEELFRKHHVDRRAIDALIFVTQSPDYVLPTSACVMQHRLGLPVESACFDVNLGCSGFVYGLALSKGLIAGGTARRVLLICAETYSRYCDPHDLSTATLFGDGAAAAIVSDDPAGALAEIGASVLGTDGTGSQDLIVESGGARQPDVSRQGRFLKMNGPEVFRFALDRVRPACHQLLQKIGKDWDSVDVFLCHQANRFMLDSLRAELQVDESKLPIDVEEVGNLSTASLPVFMSRWIASGSSKSVKNALAVGFGVGYSWGVAWLDF